MAKPHLFKEGVPFVDDKGEHLVIKKDRWFVLQSDYQELEARYKALEEATQHVWDKGIIMITDEHDDEAVATLATCLGMPYTKGSLTDKEEES